MKPTLVIAGLTAAALALPQPVAAQNRSFTYSVRNDSGHILSCGVRLRNRTQTEILTLRPGEAWSASDSRARPRTFFCDRPAAQVRYRLRAGLAYRLVEDPGTGVVRLRIG